jgi:hypothetical protein
VEILRSEPNSCKQGGLGQGLTGHVRITGGGADTAEAFGWSWSHGLYVLGLSSVVAE